MYPATEHLPLDITAISGICGSVSLACWIVVFSPQIVENFRRSSAEGLSTFFVTIWLAGDVFNVLGAVLQRVLPTMVGHHALSGAGFTKSLLADQKVDYTRCLLYAV